MKEQVKFAVGAVAALLAACCLMGALLTAWLRGASGVVAQAAAWAVLETPDALPEVRTATAPAQQDTRPLSAAPGSRLCAEGFLRRPGRAAPPGNAARTGELDR